MILFKDFQVKDLDFKTVEDISGREWSDEFALAVEDSKLAVSGVIGNKVVGCGGVHPIDDFHGELWLRLSEWCLDHKIETIRWLQAGLEIIEKTYPFKQLNASVKEGFCESEKLLKFLGFEDVQIKQGFTIYAKRVQE
jgi:hypothetical protein